MVDVLTEIQIDKPVSEVSGYSSDPDNAPNWYVNIKSAVLQTPGPLQTGSHIAFKAHFLGKELSYTYEVIEFIPQQKLVMRTSQGPFPMETTYTWEAVNDYTTRMTLRNKGYPKGFSKLFSPFMEMMMRKANQKDLKLLKGILDHK